VIYKNEKDYVSELCVNSVTHLISILIRFCMAYTVLV